MSGRAHILPLLVAGFFSVTCQHSTEPGESLFRLAVSDVEVSQVWFHISPQSSFSQNFSLQQNGVTVITLTLGNHDTDILVNALLPDHQYNFTGNSYTSWPYAEQNSTLSVRTLDTTSNNFSWQPFTFGSGGTSILYDVAIISDTEVWAGGQVFMDSANGNPDPLYYNLLRWNGKNWNIERIPYHYQGQINYQRFQAIFAANDTDVWLGGNGLIHWNGRIFSEVLDINPLWGPYWINKVWGDSNSNVYVVGGGGSAVRYDGSRWTQISTGTTLDLLDAWGPVGLLQIPSGVLAVANNIASSNSFAIMQMDKTGAKTISGAPINFPPSSIWFIPNRHYYVAGLGVFEKHSLSEPVWREAPVNLNNYYFNAIRGESTNDVFVAGMNASILHFNGVRWYKFPDVGSFNGGMYSSIAVKGNLVVVVGGFGGLNGQQAIILMGRRQ